MFYHIFIETTIEHTIGTGYKQTYLADELSLDNILENILIPHFKKETIYIKSFILEFNQIQRILVKQSHQRAEQVAKANNSRIFPVSLVTQYSELNMIKWKGFLEDITEEVIKTAKSRIINRRMKDNQLGKDKVFIVHGHDEITKIQTARFIENLGLEAIILQEQPSSGKTIIEKIEEYTNVGYGIVLYTPCDVGATKDRKDNLNQRARQNVVLEHGFLMGKLGRQNICALVKGDIEKPSDISGIVYLPIDELGGWKYKLANEMKQSGYEIDTNKIK